MTDDSETVDKNDVDGDEWGQANYQSADSARDDDLADTLAMDSIAERPQAGGALPPPAASQRSDSTMSDETNRPPATSGAQLPPPYVTAKPADQSAGRRSHRRRLEEQQRIIEERSRKRRKAPWWELPLLVVIAIVIAVLVKTFVVQPFYIPSESMEKTLHGCHSCKGDRILVNKPIYDLRDPHPGDIVVFDAPPGWNDEIAPQPPSNPVLKAIRGFGQLVGFVPPDGLVLVKRVIATGGQTIKGTADGKVMISEHGTAGPWRTLDEHTYVFRDGPDTHAAFGPVTVPKDRLWVMGDHRNDSADSRFHCGTGGADGADGNTCDATSATVPVNDVIGKAVVIAWPPSRWRTLGTPETFKHTAAALGSALPVVGSALVVVPVFLVRRRRRRV